VPLIVYAPKAKGNGRPCPRVVQSLDIYPTLVDLCKLPMPRGLEGLSLTPLLADPQAKWDHPAFSVSGNNNKLAGVAVRTERYRYADFGDGPKGGLMLFDHMFDPGENRNLADDPQAARVRAELAELVRNFRAGKYR
jgi:arylsulfatase A-like enzyme